MTYTKPNQAQFATNLASHEFVVQIDSGEFVAIGAKGTVEPNTGNIVMEATARVVHADGSPYCDVNGHEIRSEYNFSADEDNVKAMGGMAEFQRKMLLTVLGEDANWFNPPALDILNHASIRTNITSSDHAGPVLDLGNLI